MVILIVICINEVRLLIKCVFQTLIKETLVGISLQRTLTGIFYTAQAQIKFYAKHRVSTLSMLIVQVSYQVRCQGSLSTKSSKVTSQGQGILGVIVGQNSVKKTKVGSMSTLINRKHSFLLVIFILKTVATASVLVKVYVVNLLYFNFIEIT